MSHKHDDLNASRSSDGSANGAEDWMLAADLGDVIDALTQRLDDNLGHLASDSFRPFSPQPVATAASSTAPALASVNVAEGGKATIAGPGTASVAFAGSSGTLVIQEAQGFHGEVAGMSGSDTLDLADLKFSADTQATFVGTASGGTLTVSNGTQTAKIALTGDYLSSTWSLSNDGNGGTNVVDPTVAGNWQVLKVGAGGFADGLDENPDGTIVVRTDTNGAYLWNGSSWQQLVTASSMPAAYIAANPVSSGQGVYEIQMAPSNSNIMYMMFNGEIFTSTNKGTTWVQTSFAQVTENSNDNFRLYGQKMAVDPNNSNIVYAGTPQNGLWMTTNGGTSWSQVSAIPVSGTSNGQYPGITGILFDPAIGGVVNGVTQTIFASSYGNGVYESTNGGSTWTHLAGGPSDVEYATVGPNGAYYAVGNNNTSLWRYYNGAWTELLQANDDIQAVVINRQNPNEIVSVAPSGYLRISYDGGATWSNEPTPKVVSSDIPWEASAQMAPGNAYMYLSIGGAAFSTSNPNELILSTGTGSFDVTVPTSNPTSAPLVYTDNSVGIENLVARQILATPGGSLVLASWDRPFIKVNDLNSYPTSYGPVASTQIVAGWSIDYASSTPTFLVGLADFWGEEESGYSTDGGATWTKFTTELSGGGSSFIGGTIAASTTQNFIWAPADGNQPYYTLNGGQTWNPITLPGVTSWSNFDWAYYLTGHTVTADRVLANTFYLYDPGVGPGTGAGLFETTNGGQTWTEVYSGAISQWAANFEITSVPGQAGNLFFTAGIQGNGTNPPSYAQFMMSTNQGKTWTAVPNVLEVTCFGFGAAAPGQSYPSIYIVGYVNNVFGVWQSTNQAQSWTQIGTQPVGELDQITTISGDPNVFGRVYVGFAGGGYAYLSGGPYVTGVTTNPASGVEGVGSTVTITVKLSAAATISGGAPTLNLNDGGVATYVSGSGSNTLTFTYTVSSGDSAVSTLAVSSVSLNGAVVQDSSGNVASLSGAVTSFANLSVGPTTTSVANYLANKTALDAAGNIKISDTAAAVSAAIGTINGDAKVAAITLTGTPTLSLNVAQALGDASALGKITNSNYGIAVTDTGANISANFDALNADSRITTILPAGGSQTLTLSLGQVTSDANAIALLDPFTITVSDTAVHFNALSLTEIAQLGVDGVTLLDVTDSDASLTPLQHAALSAAGISVEQPFSGGSYEIVTYNATGTASTVDYEGITGQPYTSFLLTYGANGKPANVLYGNGETKTWTYSTSNGTYQIAFANVPGQAYSSYTIKFTANGKATSATFSNGMTETWAYNSDGSWDYVLRNVPNMTYTVMEGVFSANGSKVANAFDMVGNSGKVILDGNGLTTSAASGALSLKSGADTFALDAHASELFVATGYSSETFGFGAGFGQDTIVGFAAGGTGGDALSLKLASFSGLSAANTAAQNAAILLSNHAMAQVGSNVTITDTAGDTLTLLGVTTTALTQYASSIFRFN